MSTPYETIHLGGVAAAVVPLEDLAELHEGAALGQHLADKLAGTVTGVTDEELDAALDRIDAEDAR